MTGDMPLCGLPACWICLTETAAARGAADRESEAREIVRATLGLRP
jgi:hypothetical protein